MHVCIHELSTTTMCLIKSVNGIFSHHHFFAGGWYDGIDGRVGMVTTGNDFDMLACCRFFPTLVFGIGLICLYITL